jgi:hypothetical protein
VHTQLRHSGAAEPPDAQDALRPLSRQHAAPLLVSQVGLLYAAGMIGIADVHKNRLLACLGGALFGIAFIRYGSELTQLRRLHRRSRRQASRGQAATVAAPNLKPLRENVPTEIPRQRRITHVPVRPAAPVVVRLNKGTTAQARKQAAPAEVFQLAAARSSTEPFDGTT